MPVCRFFHCCDVSVLFYFYIDLICLLTDQTQKEFDEFFWKTPLGRYIAKADPEIQTEIFQRYLQDFVSMTMHVTSQQDLKVDFLQHLKPLNFKLCVCAYVCLCVLIYIICFLAPVQGFELLCQ